MVSSRAFPSLCLQLSSAKSLGLEAVQCWGPWGCISIPANAQHYGALNTSPGLVGFDGVVGGAQMDPLGLFGRVGPCFLFPEASGVGVGGRRGNSSGSWQLFGATRGSLGRKQRVLGKACGFLLVFPNAAMLPQLPGSSKPCAELIGPHAAVKPMWAAGLRVESAPDIGPTAFPTRCLILSVLFCPRGNPAIAPQLWGRAALLPSPPGGCQVFT